MKVEGYKFKGYDATYQKALFNVIEKENRVLEITDVDSGEVILLDFKGVEFAGKTRTWRQEDSGKKQHGTYITFGSKGVFEELKYSGRKRKDNI